MNEMYKEFQQLQNNRFDVDNLEKHRDELNLKNLELNEQANTYREKYEEMIKVCHEMEECMKLSFVEKEEAEKSFRDELNKKTTENGILANTAASLEKKSNILLEDLNKSKKELNQLATDLTELYNRENEHKLNIDKLYNENIQLQEQFTKFEDQKAQEILQLQGLIEKMNSKTEAIETERNKVQEELDTLNQTLNYNTDELEEKKNLLVEYQAKVISFSLKAYLIIFLAV